MTSRIGRISADQKRVTREPKVAVSLEDFLTISDACILVVGGSRETDAGGRKRKEEKTVSLSLRERKRL